MFECYDTKGELRAIFGGGRYDKIIGLFGGDDMPAVGFGMGDAVLEILDEAGEVWPKESITTDYYVLTTSPAISRDWHIPGTIAEGKELLVETDMQGT